MLYSLVDICEIGTGLFSDCLKLKNEGTTFLQNTGHQSCNDTVSYTIRLTTLVEIYQHFRGNS